MSETCWTSKLYHPTYLSTIWLSSIYSHINVAQWSHPHRKKKKSKSFFPPKTMKRLPILRLTLWPLIIYQATFALAAVDPTQGFTRVPLDNSNFVIQKPYDVSVNQRYSFTNGVHKFWVYSTDKPHTPASDTKPRTEIRINVCKPHLDAYSIILLFYFIKNI